MQKILNENAIKELRLPSKSTKIYKTNSHEHQMNQKIFQHALFQPAFTLSKLSHDPYLSMPHMATLSQ